MKPVSLTAYQRTLTRRGGAKKIRQTGRLPAVIYGAKSEAQNLEVDRKALEELVHHSASETMLVDLNLDQDSRPKRLALVQEVQHHPLSGSPLHVDFHEISETESVTIMVPIEAIGEPVGVKTGGGVLEHVLFKARVRSLPKDLPDAIRVDVSALEVGQSIHIRDIKPPEGVEFLSEPHISVLAVAAPITETQEGEEGAGPAQTEVEMIKEKKENAPGGSEKGDAKKK